MILVIAGNYEQATRWARERQLPPTEWTYVFGPEKLRGWSRDTPVVITGTRWLGTYSDVAKYYDLIHEALVRFSNVRDEPTIPAIPD